MTKCTSSVPAISKKTAYICIRWGLIKYPPQMLPELLHIFTSFTPFTVLSTAETELVLFINSSYYVTVNSLCSIMQKIHKVIINNYINSTKDLNGAQLCKLRWQTTKWVSQTSRYWFSKTQLVWAFQMNICIVGGSNFQIIPNSWANMKLYKIVPKSNK